jgi:hypothetical protein
MGHSCTCMHIARNFASNLSSYESTDFEKDMNSPKYNSCVSYVSTCVMQNEVNDGVAFLWFTLSCTILWFGFSCKILWFGLSYKILWFGLSCMYCLWNHFLKQVIGKNRGVRHALQESFSCDSGIDADLLPLMQVFKVETTEIHKFVVGVVVTTGCVTCGGWWSSVGEKPWALNTSVSIGACVFIRKNKCIYLESIDRRS